MAQRCLAATPSPQPLLRATVHSGVYAAAAERACSPGPASNRQVSCPVSLLPCLALQGRRYPCPAGILADYPAEFRNPELCRAAKPDHIHGLPKAIANAPPYREIYPNCHFSGRFPPKDCVKRIRGYLGTPPRDLAG